jgi:hypothetical protein
MPEDEGELAVAQWREALAVRMKFDALEHETAEALTQMDTTAITRAEHRRCGNYI